GKTKQDLFQLNWTQLLGKDGATFDQLEAYLLQNSKLVSVPIPKAGSVAAMRKLKEFKRQALDRYAEARDFPNVKGTSQLSIFLKNGSLTVAQIIAELELQNQTFAEKSGPSVYLKELAWREFYYYILFHHPRVEQEAFLSKFKNIAWENRPEYFEAWKNGMTGYPIVDAGMRQLNQTGWMHNRVRMIVASFLTKDLLVSWQWGERYFMEKLLDGDLAPNNGGWQWAASTGCDPQPYFRIFNPRLQSEKFDPTGEYIKTYIPELAEFSPKEIHVPSESGRSSKYPSPIVDHQEQKEKALELYDV
ncbi:MAG: deoxyribodipyrimidine photo-lyase, partial [Deltaproteobacteria bacterium]|nr:deoxyribodipyrimidine photo-lyase [Deltaproteobacteria bacterium]